MRISKKEFKHRVPAWAEKALEDGFAALEKAKTSPEEILDRFNSREIGEETATLSNWGERRDFLRFRRWDNDEAEGADRDPRPNELDLGHSQYQLSGSLTDGQITQKFRETAIVVTKFEGNQTSSVRVDDGSITSFSYLDGDDPAKSFRFEHPRFEESRDSVAQESSLFSATTAAAPLLSENLENHPNDPVASLFLGERDKIPQTRAKLMGEIQSSLGKLGQNGHSKLTALLKNPDAKTPGRLHEEALQAAKVDPENKELNKLLELSGNWQMLEDLPKIMADGLIRTQEYYVSPMGLQLQTAARDWDLDSQTGLPIADTAIVGAGPGGLASGYHLSNAGQHTVIFEGGKLGQAFSDASAQSVHELRTDGDSSNLIYTRKGESWRSEASLTGNFSPIRKKSRDAKSSWNEQIGEKNHSGSDTYVLNRNSLFEHMAQLGHGLATRYPDTFLMENSPVSTIETVERDGETLFRLKSEKGHDILARSLVMATGFVGTQGENARSLAQFSELEQKNPERVTTLNSDHDLIRKNDDLVRGDTSLVFSDRLLGRPEIRQRIKDLPKGARLAVVGGGESAVKGAIEALELNPDIKIDLLTNREIEPYQVQIPAAHFSNNVTEYALKDDEVAEKTLRQFQTLGTPVTTQTMKKLLAFESEGRLRIREMGKRFDPSTVEVSLKDNGKFSLKLKDSEVAQNLQQQREEWLEAGLYGDKAPENSATELEDVDMVMEAIGYNVQKVNASPLMQQLIDQDLVEIKDGKVQFSDNGLMSAKSDKIAFNTAGAVKVSADTALPGRAVRGMRLSRAFREFLPQRNTPEDRIAPYHGEAQEYDDPEAEPRELPEKSSVLSGLDFSNNGLREEAHAHREAVRNAATTPEDREWITQYQELNAKFNGPNRTVHALVGRYYENPESLTPAERLTAQRALQIADRLASVE